MKPLRILISLPGENNYLREQAETSKSTAQRLGLETQIVNANSDSVTQSQQLLELIQSRDQRPDAVIVEPVTNAGLPRVAEAAVSAGIGWVISNARVDYLEQLRKGAKVPVFAVTQDHTEIGRMQGRQFVALLPKGGSVLYLRGPVTNFLASRRAEGMENVLPENIQVKTLKIQWTAESAYNSVGSWLRLPSVRAADTHLIASQNTDFILAAREAFRNSPDDSEGSRWLDLPCSGVGTAKQAKPLVDDGTLVAAAITSTTMDTALEMLVQAIHSGSQPQDHTYVRAWSYPSLEELTEKRR